VPFAPPFTESYYASGFVISKRLENHPMWQRVNALHAKDSWVGCSRLPCHGWVIKVLAGGSVALRRTLQQIRAEIYSAAGATCSFASPGPEFLRQDQARRPSSQGPVGIRNKPMVPSKHVCTRGLRHNYRVNLQCVSGKHRSLAAPAASTLAVSRRPPITICPAASVEAVIVNW
jgi:hypothetical protein